MYRDTPALLFSLFKLDQRAFKMVAAAVVYCRAAVTTKNIL